MDEILEVIEVICECGKCEACRARELSLVVGECTCVYEEVVKTDEEGNEYTERVLVTKCDYHKTIEAINTKYDNYRLMEKANINQDLWDECTVIDGVIFTPQIEIDTTHKTTEERLTDLIEQVGFMDAVIANLTLEVL